MVSTSHIYFSCICHCECETASQDENKEKGQSSRVSQLKQNIRDKKVLFSTSSYAVQMCELDLCMCKRLPWSKSVVNKRQRYGLYFENLRFCLNDPWANISSESQIPGLSLELMPVRGPYLWTVANHSVHLLFHFTLLKSFNSCHKLQRTGLLSFMGLQQKPKECLWAQKQ